ncbi:MAG: tRNA epoxyqueuosine(34) reductase QueG [Muribaculaceae bacterium]|nr:tRNA epoxyqueuosine(34) reductase QueG [Muribaculaceae bacterium]
MNSEQFPCSSDLRAIADDLGFSAIGVAEVSEVPQPVIDQYNKWIKAIHHGEMAYMERYEDIRRNPRLLLDNAQSIIAVVANYHSPLKPRKNALKWASYSLGDDYHDVMRKKLAVLASFVEENWGGEIRVCVDTAPIFERYWAQQAGVGFIGKNSMLIVPEVGSYVFIGIILSTVKFQPNEPCTLSCMGCNACIRHCPGKAISLSSTIDARRCHSYLSIEYRGELPSELNLDGKIYGCDVCQSVCPHNFNAPTTKIAEFLPRQEIIDLSHDDINAMTQEDFSRIFRRSAIKRTKLTGLQRNNLHCTKK